MEVWAGSGGTTGDDAFGAFGDAFGPADAFDDTFGAFCDRPFGCEFQHARVRPEFPFPLYCQTCADVEKKGKFQCARCEIDGEKQWFGKDHFHATDLYNCKKKADMGEAAVQAALKETTVAAVSVGH